MRRLIRSEIAPYAEKEPVRTYAHIHVSADDFVGEVATYSCVVIDRECPLLNTNANAGCIPYQLNIETIAIYLLGVLGIFAGGAGTGI